jgi:hypothetical protein
MHQPLKGNLHCIYPGANDNNLPSIGHSLHESIMSQAKRKASGITQDSDGGWSIVPSDNFSDWTIQLRNKGTDTVTSYYVHRKDLARGNRKSDYFEWLLVEKADIAAWVFSR